MAGGEFSGGDGDVGGALRRFAHVHCGHRGGEARCRRGSGEDKGGDGGEKKREGKVELKSK